MTISTTLNKVRYAANGATTEFDFNFLVPRAVDLKVYVENSSGAVTLVEAGYSVSGLNDPTGGTVVYSPDGPLSSGNFITIARELTYTQGTDLTNQDGFYPEVIEDALDRLTMLLQQVKEVTDRSVKAPITDVEPIELPSAAARAGKGLAFDANGVPIATNDTGAAAIARAGAEAAQTAAEQAAAVAVQAAENAVAVSGIDLSLYLQKADNLGALPDKAAARTNLGLHPVAASGHYADLGGKPTLGTAAALNTGTNAGDVVVLGTGGKLPAVDGSLLTNLPSSGGTTLPAGVMMPYGGTSAPTGWLLCDGAAVNRTTYADLFTALSTAFGAGDGTTTFNVPDLRGRVPVGKDNMGGTAVNRITNAVSGFVGTTLGASGGLQSHTLTTTEIPAHAHSGASASTANSYAPGDGSGAGVPAAGADTGSAGGGGAHRNVQPSLIVNYIIKT